MTSTRYVFPPALLNALAGLVPGPKSSLSPLNSPNPIELSPDQRAQLAAAGMIDDHGLVEPARLLLESLSEVASFARLRVSAPAGFLDEAIHFSEDGAQTVGVSSTPQGLALSSPGDSTAILKQVREMIGDSPRPAATWGVDLPALEMLALAVLLDLRRKAVLRAILEQQPVVPPPSDPRSLTAAIQAMFQNPQWLVAAVFNTAGLTALPSEVQVQEALRALVEKKMAFQQGNTFMPLPNAIAVIDRFLLIGAIVTLDAGHANLQGRFVILRQSWLQAGVCEMLRLYPVENQMRLEVVAPSTTLDTLRKFLTEYDALPAPAMEAVALSGMIQSGIGIGQVFQLEDETVMGRSEQASIRIFDARASRRHAVIRRLSQGYQLSDAGSTNGTFLNNQLVKEPIWLHEGDVVRIGDTELRIIRAGQTPPPVQNDRTMMAGPAPTPAEPASAPFTPAEPEMPSLEPEVIIETSATPEPPQPVKAVIEEERPATTEESAPLAVTEEEPAPAPEPASELPPPPEIPPLPEVPPPPYTLETIVEPEPATPPVSPAQPEEPASLQLCARCREPLQPGDLVCQNCGQQVDQPVGVTAAPPPSAPAVCPNCGSPIIPGARFCGTCGFRLAQ